MPVDGYLVGGRAGVRAAVRFQPVWRRRQAANLPEHLQMRAQLRTGTFRGRFECRHRFYQKCPYSRSQVKFTKEPLKVLPSKSFITYYLLLIYVWNFQNYI